LGSLRGVNAHAVQMAPMSALELHSAVSATPGLKIKKTISSPNAVSPMATTAGEATDLFVAEISAETVPFLRAQNHNRLVIERNEPLEFSGMGLFSAPAFMPPADLNSMPKPAKVKIRVIGKDDKPQASARVMLQAAGMPQSGVTDSKGETTLDLWTVAGAPAQSLWVKPKDNHWDLYLERPNLVDSTVNIVRLEAFSETSPGFPDNFTQAWGLEAMGLSGRPDFVKGKGVKIAIIDSGCDNAHPLLQHVTQGADVSSDRATDGWKNDTIGHGTHVCGVIAARSAGGTGFNGFAPEAEVHVIKVFPGGYDSLIEAIHYCIANRIDVVNMSLGGPEASVHVEQAIQEATAAGIACIVAAGNSGDSVKFPASSANTLAVSAVGSSSKTRRNSWGRTQIVANSIANDGIYAAKFSCHGPEITVCAPGVAIVSTVPGDSYGADDGTSMASPHVTGLAALILAHSPIFRSTYTARNAERVTALFAMLQNMCRPYTFTEGRAGRGFPNLSSADFSAFMPADDGPKPADQPNVLNPASAVPGSQFQPFQPQSAGPLGMFSTGIGNASQPVGNFAARRANAPNGYYAPFTPMYRSYYPVGGYGGWIGNQ
jgi:subtilisin family serine protease